MNCTRLCREPRDSFPVKDSSTRYAIRGGTKKQRTPTLARSDKRLLVVESEFAQVLKVCERNGSTLSVTVREFWDTGTVQSLAKKMIRVKATDAHIGSHWPHYPGRAAGGAACERTS